MPKKLTGGKRLVTAIIRRWLHEVLQDQDWQENQPVTFMTDGGDTVINIVQHIAPAWEHILDWFHITMRITVMDTALFACSCT